MIYAYQTREIEKELLTQGKRVARSLFRQQDSPFSKIDHSFLEELIKRTEQMVLDFRIVSLKVYDLDLGDILHYAAEDISAVKELQKGLPSGALPTRGSEQYTFTERHGRWYLHLQGSVDDLENQLCFFESTVQVDQEVMKRLQRSRMIAVVVTTVTILSMALVLYPLILSAYKRLQRAGRDLLESNLNTVIALGNAVAKRDSDTDIHNFRVTYYSLRLAEHLNLPPGSMRSLAKGAFLHDVGKIGIRDQILLKTDRLTREEFAVMKTHVELGEEIIRDIPWLADCREVIRFHHEKYDGKGYPMGKAGEEIPLMARVFAVADVFDALTSVRPYKAAFSYVEAIEIMKKEARQYDPLVFQRFLEVSEAIYSETVRMSRDQIAEKLLVRISPYFGLEKRQSA
ncbi:MAG: HD-GYP domain-containing protein [Desulfobacteraceae bacterium]|nr:MAG: HD-GYP domain-containing protein [Desulfobacteraceae bacterium]